MLQTIKLAPSSAALQARTARTNDKIKSDNEVTIWSLQGRIHQTEYAIEAVKQGSATAGLKPKSHTVLAALKRAVRTCSSSENNSSC